MEFPYEIYVDRRAVTAFLFILVLAAAAFFFIYRPIASECGNGIVEGMEECDRSLCRQGFYCGAECSCLPAQGGNFNNENNDCAELHGFLCELYETCSGRILDAGQPNCCSVECTAYGGEPPSSGDSGSGTPGAYPGSGDQDGGQGGDVDGGIQDGSAAGQGVQPGQEYCRAADGMPGFNCTSEKCFGKFEDGCCVGMCTDYPIQGFTECNNICLSKKIYSDAQCEELCSPQG